MELADLLKHVTTVLERLRIPHFVTGSIATIAYGEPRLTNDIDIVIRVQPRQIADLCREFPDDEFYVSPEMAADAAERGGQFNILHPRSGLKVDVMVADGSAFNESRFGRIQKLPVSPELDVPFASPEDVILKKLEYYREGGSDKHLRDIAGVLATMGAEIDQRYIAAWAQRLGVLRIWRRVCDGQAACGPQEERE